MNKYTVKVSMEDFLYKNKDDLNKYFNINKIYYLLKLVKTKPPIISIGHKFGKLGLYDEYKGKKEIQIKGKEIDYNFSWVFIHEFGHFLAKNFLNSIYSYIDFVYLKEQELLDKGVDFNVISLRNTKRKKHLRLRLKNKEPHVRNFKGYNIHFYHTSEPPVNVLGHTDYPIYIGEKKLREHLRYRKDNDGFITDYSKKKPEEEFCEHLAGYMLCPSLLKEQCYNKYKFFEEKLFL